MDKNDQDIIRYYEREYERSGKKLEESKVRSRLEFLNYLFDKLGLDFKTRVLIRKDMVVYLLQLEGWKRRLAKALKRILPLPPKY